MHPERAPEHDGYIADTSGGAEMARLIDQDLLVTQAIGLFPETIDLLPVRRLLDIACGPGGWAREVARSLPDVDIIGVDINRDMIKYANTFAQVMHLPSISFQVMDVTQPLAFPDASFDLVNARFLFAFVSRATWPLLIKECARLLRPGGIFILTDTDKLCTSNSKASETFLQMIIESMINTGYYAGTSGSGITPHLTEFFEGAGLTSIETREHTIPFSQDNPNSRNAIAENLRIAFQIIQPFLLKMDMATQQELDALYEQAMSECAQPSFAGHLDMTTIWGSKPLQ